MGSKSAPGSWHFSSFPGFTFDFAAKYQEDDHYRAPTLPGLGLDEKFAERQGFSPPVGTSGESLTPWQIIEAYVRHLNDESDDTIKYKVLYVTRHALGVHNAFENEVGRDTWNKQWGYLDGHGDIVWADAKLHSEGHEQTAELGRLWLKLASVDKAPVPRSIYTSPLTRCLETTQEIFRDVCEENGVPFHPIVKELLRKRLTDQTPERRSSRSILQSNFPDFVIEPGFSEEDELWTGKAWENEKQVVERKRIVLNDIFDNDDNEFIALTAHSKSVLAIQALLGVQEFKVKECSCMAFLVKGEKVN